MALRHGFLVLVLGLAPAVLAGACSSKSSAGSGAGGSVVRFSVPAGTAMPRFLDVPFPSDLYLQNGKIVDPVPGFDAVFKQNSQFLTHELAKLDGFSRIALSLFYVDDTTKPVDADGNPAVAAVDPTTLPVTEADCTADSSAVFLIDLAATDPASARVLCRAAYHDDTSHYSKTRPVLAVGPARGIVLAEGHAYAAVITDRVKDAAGNKLSAGADFASMASRTDAAGTLYGGALTKVEAALGPALKTDGSHVVGIAPFTTNTMSKELFQMREAIEGVSPPALSWDAASMAPMGATKFAAPVGGTLPAGFTASLDDWLGVVASAAKLPDGSDDPDADLPVPAHDKIAAIGSAVYEGANFMQQKPHGYDDLDDATFVHDAKGNVIPVPGAPTLKIWVTFAVPTAPMPASGYPTVIVQHGLGGSRSDEFFHLANTFAKQGWLVAGIDSVTFGARAIETIYQTDKATDWEGAPGATYKGPDGLADKVDLEGNPSPSGTRNGSTDLFGGLRAIGALRDQLRQAEFDISELVNLLHSGPDLSALQTGAAAPKIDPDRIGYVGDSLGAIEGSVAAAIEPHCKLWVLNVGGGGLLNELAAHAPAIGQLLTLAGGVNFGFQGDYFTESHPMTSIIQTVADLGDPLTYAGFLVKNPGTIKGATLAPRNILQIEVVYDELVANEADEALARAGGYGLATPNVGSNAGVSTMAYVRAPNTVPQRVPLPDVGPDAAGLIHDTPSKGITAVVIQTSPSQHGDDMVAGKGHRQYAIPYGQFDTNMPFVKFDTGKDFSVRDSYREIQIAVSGFLGDGFAGKVPNVAGWKPPIRDFDDDGNPDATDPDPNDPNVK